MNAFVDALACPDGFFQQSATTSTSSVHCRLSGDQCVPVQDERYRYVSSRECKELPPVAVPVSTPAPAAVSASSQVSVGGQMDEAKRIVKRLKDIGADPVDEEKILLEYERLRLQQDEKAAEGLYPRLAYSIQSSAARVSQKYAWVALFCVIALLCAIMYLASSPERTEKAKKWMDESLGEFSEKLK
jgi:hypothetical protein